MKNDMKSVRELKFKMEMMGIPIDGLAFVCGDNMLGIHTRTHRESGVNVVEKSNLVCYHYLLQGITCYGRTYD